MNLTPIFKHQLSLMEKLKPVEISLGYTPPSIPLDFTIRAHQDWFRSYSWYLVEELVEAQTAPPALLAEEMADALHFAVELCIMADISPYRVESLIYLQSLDPCPELSTLNMIIVHLGLANNLLKAKPWKKEPKPTHIPTFQNHLMNSLISLLACFTQLGIDPHEEYFKKHKINEKRIRDGY